jgi:hypothetical protein
MFSKVRLLHQLVFTKRYNLDVGDNQRLPDFEVRGSVCPSSVSRDFQINFFKKR